jgi:hypothetical protein
MYPGPVENLTQHPSRDAASKALGEWASARVLSCVTTQTGSYPSYGNGTEFLSQIMGGETFVRKYTEIFCQITMDSGVKKAYKTAIF